MHESRLNGNGHKPETAHAGVAPASFTEATAAAVRNSRAAQERWRHVPLESRLVALRRAAKEMLRRRGEVVALAREEMGKVDAEGLFNEALGPLDAVNAWGRVVERGTKRRVVRLNPVSFPGKAAWVDYVPRGVVGVISPWNFPVAGLYRPVLPALLAGNGVVVKPSEYTPRTSAWLIERLAAELPDGLASVVQGDGKAGAALVGAGIDACVFTGSTRAGRLVRIQCAERGIPSSIEMGGKDAAIVLADCDLPRTVAGVTHWTLSNVGQACGAIEIAYVDRRIADEFLERLARAWSRLDGASVGPLGNPMQLEVVASHVEDARAKGARVVCGGTRGEGLRFAPTILDGCDANMSVVTDETFGPLLAVVRIDGANEAIRAINASRYGLGASIWTRDLARAQRLAERLDVGVVNVNNHAFTGAVPALPWSGTRETGFGVANGPEALTTFVRTRVTTVDRSGGPDVYWMPYDANFSEMADVLADAQVGKLGRAWRLPLLMRRRLQTIREFFRS
jgi:acyl-CoA reductase-like NAD-dependent aldehyde dehydrogenase